MVVVCCSSWLCRVMASVTVGWQCPTLTVTIPAKACGVRAEGGRVRMELKLKIGRCTSFTDTIQRPSYVQVAPSVLIVEILHFPLNDHDGLLEMVKESCDRAAATSARVSAIHLGFGPIRARARDWHRYIHGLKYCFRKASTSSADGPVYGAGVCAKSGIRGPVDCSTAGNEEKSARQPFETCASKLRPINPDPDVEVPSTLARKPAMLPRV